MVAGLCMDTVKLPSFSAQVTQLCFSQGHSLRSTNFLFLPILPIVSFFNFNQTNLLSKILIIHCWEILAQFDDAWRSDAKAAAESAASGYGNAENTSTAVNKHCFSARTQVDTVALLSSGII